MKFQVSMNRSYVDMTLATVIFLDLDQVWCQTFRHQTWIRIIRQAPVEVMRLANFRDDLKILHKTQECSKEIWKRGHRSLMKNKTQTELINIVNLRILYQLNVSYAGQHTLSKVIYTPGGGYSHTLPIRVCAAQRGHDFKAPDLERGIHFRGVL